MSRQNAVHMRAVVHQGLLGFVFGFVLLHPISMVIFHWLDPRLIPAMPGSSGGGALSAVLHSFAPSMFPMGIVYGLLTGLIATVNGYQRAIIQSQRDALKTQNVQLERLQRTNKRNTRFIVHDLRTHVGCILGFSNLLLEDQGSQRSAEDEDALRRIRRQAIVMGNNIDELLQFDQLQETDRVQREEVSVAELLLLTLDVLSPLEQGQEVVIAPASENCPGVLGDSNLLRRVLVNLASNSLRHNPGSTHVLLKAEPLSGGTEVLFSCIDDGDGIPIEMQDCIFEEFSSSAQEQRASSGLGLAFCKAAVEAHGGRIWYEDKGHGGTGFHFTVPMTKEEV